ncbi:MAG TPA: methyltransferase domain-containing protein [Micromonosporaceae bacterium]
MNEVWRHLRCPVCAAPLTPGQGSLGCPHGHRFDLARQGYVNLLTGRVPAGAETPAMVADRAAMLDAGHFAFLAAALAAAAGDATGAEPGLVVDVGAGTGYYLAAVLDRLPGHAGIGLDVAKAACRRAARAHHRAAAAVCDVWRGLPLADRCAALILDVFAPRNGAEFHRVLRPDGALLVVTPEPDHLAGLVEALGLVRVDPAKDRRLAASLSDWFLVDHEHTHRHPLVLNHMDVAHLVGMGPSAWHLEPAELARRIARLPDRVEVPASVRLRRFRVRWTDRLPPSPSAVPDTARA